MLEKTVNLIVGLYAMIRQWTAMHLASIQLPSVGVGDRHHDVGARAGDLRGWPSCPRRMEQLHDLRSGYASLAWVISGRVSARLPYGGLLCVE